LIVAFANDGVSGVPGVLRVTVENLAGSFKLSGCLDAGQPYAGRLRQAGFILPRELFGQKIEIRAELETHGVARPVEWACAQALNPDKSLAIQLKEKGKLVWGEVF